MADYTKIPMPFEVTGGLDIKTQSDLLPKGSYRRFTNLEVQQILHAPMIRRSATKWPPSLLSLYNVSNAINTFRAVFAPAGRVQPPLAGIVGAGTNLYDLFENLLDTGYSGNPLGVAEYRESGNSNPWFLIADFNKMTKVQPFAQIGPVRVAQLGISPPGAVPPYIGAGAPATSVAAGGVGNLDSSTGVGYDWRYTYYSMVTEAESNPSAIQRLPLLSLTNQSADLTPGAFSSDPQVDTIRWWRRGGTLGDTWRLVGTQANGTVSGTDLASPNGIIQFFGLTLDAPNGLSESGNTVTVTLDPSTIPLGVQAGDNVIIYQATVGGYNGTFQITSIISPTQFQYYNPTSGLGPSGGTPTNRCRTFWTVVEVSATAPVAVTAGMSLTFSGDSTAFYNAAWTVRYVTDSTHFWIYCPTLTLGTGSGGGSTFATTPFNDNSADVTIASADVLSLTNDVPVTTIDQNNNTVYQQPLPYIWGPYQGNTFFGTGDPNRRGFVYWSNPGNPDGWSSVNNVEVTQPTDPLANGFVWNGRVFVFSSEKLSEGVPLTIGNIVTYEFFDTGAGHGLASPWAFEAGPTSPRVWYYTRSAGIVEWAGGGHAVSITEDKLWPLFASSVFSPVLTPVENLYPVDSGSGNPRMRFHDQEVRFCYTDTNGNSGNVLAYHIHSKRWRHALYPWAINCMESVDQGEDQTLIYGADSLYGESSSFGGQDDALTSGKSQNIAFDLKTGYSAEPDYEAMKEYGNVVVDYDAEGMIVNAAALFADGTLPSINALISNNGGRGQTPIPLGDTYARDMAVELSGSASVLVTLFGLEILYKLDVILISHSFSSMSAWGQSAYLSITPNSYITLRSTAPVNVTIATDNGVSFMVTLPSTSGKKLKMQLDAIPANKELLFSVSVDSTQPFRLYPEESFVEIMPWAGIQPALVSAFSS